MAGPRAQTSDTRTDTVAASAEMSVFSDAISPHEEPAFRTEIESSGGPLAEGIRRDPPAWSKLRLIGGGLGRYRSRIIAFPTRSGATIHFALLGPTAAEPGMWMSYAPADRAMPAAMRGQRFMPVAPWSRHAGTSGTQLFGIALDDVVKIRVEVAGEWRNVPLANNGFYLDLPGVRQELVGLVEATLADGTTQLHDIRDPTRV